MLSTEYFHRYLNLPLKISSEQKLTEFLDILMQMVCVVSFKFVSVVAPLELSAEITDNI